MRSTCMTVVSLATSEADLLEKTVAFYQGLGFVVNEDWSVRNAESANHKPHGSEREVVLILPSDDSGSEAAVTVRQTALGVTRGEAEARINKLEAAKNTGDWRTMYPATLFPVCGLAEASILESHVSKQINPPVGTPRNVFVYDPLGNLLGFTSQDNPVSHVRQAVPRPDPTAAPELLPSDIQFDGPSDLGKGDKGTKESLRKVAVLTSGGDAPGMNAAVRAVVRSAIHSGCDAYAVYEGYEGLIQGGDYIRRMEWDDVRGYLSIGGTSIGTARSLRFRERAGRLDAAHNMVKHGIDSLVVCGGDGSLTGADLFRHDWPGLIKELQDTGRINKEEAERHAHLNICGMVGSIDNDMAMTDVTIGAYSSLDRICVNVDWIEATAKSHSRAFVIEVMGRHCGWLALLAAISTHADFAFLPERPPDAGKWHDKLAKTVKRHREGGRRRTIVIVAEGAIDSELNPIRASDVMDVLVNIGLDTRVTTLGHVQRGGPAVASDRLLATLQGAEAVRAILDAKPDTPSPMIGVKENQIVRVNLVDAVKETKSVAEAISVKDFEKARSLRDAEFQEQLSNYIMLSNSDHVHRKFEAEKKLRVAIVAVGAPAGGMDAAISSAASYCFARGHRAFAIHNSWTGLARHESVREISWFEAEDMFAQGGCQIGTNRNLPDCDLGMIAYYFGKYRFDGLIIIGGFEAYRSLHILANARSTYPSFRIPMVCLPATISNNVPGTEYSLGADTCVNSLVQYCDVLKQSASSTRRRVFIVEVQGGKCGYIASYSALVCGAHAAYIPEEGISLSQMSADIKHLRECFSQDEGRTRAGRLVIRNEKASPGFTTQNLASIFETESHHKFDAREAIPGHLQQGDMPSPIDRVRATRLSIRCVQFIEEEISGLGASNGKDSSQSAVVIGIDKSKIVLTPVDYLWDYETDLKNRRPTSVYWMKLLDMADMMTQRPVVNRHAPDSVPMP